MNSRFAELYIGLMSGTSLDGIDAALVEFSQTGRPRLLHACNLPIPDTLRAETLRLCQPGADEINRCGELDRHFGLLFAQAALSVVELAGYTTRDVRAIGSHGQTIRHHPDKSSPFTWQIGDPNTIAWQTGITTVADFRRMDIAAGGQGAPLVPAFHDAVLRNTSENRVIVNIGGMANITLLGKTAPVLGFDTGPGNVLMDGWIQRHQQQPHDAGGQWAATGQCIEPLLARMMSHAYIQASHPKSTGRETFHSAWLDGELAHFPDMSAADIQRTLLEFTAASIAQAILALPGHQDKVLLCGGGSHNTLLKQRIQALLPKTIVGTTTVEGIDADWLEAMAFAWLAQQRMESLSGNLPSVTGAAHPCILGGVYLPA